MRINSWHPGIQLLTLYMTFVISYFFATVEVCAREELALPANSTKAWKAPKVVLIFDRECAVWCNEVKPIVKELEAVYKDRVDFVSFDTSAAALAASRSAANSIGLAKFFKENMHYAPVVGVFDTNHKLVKELVGPKDKAAYRDAIVSALSAK